MGYSRLFLVGPIELHWQRRSWLEFVSLFFDELIHLEQGVLIHIVEEGPLL